MFKSYEYIFKWHNKKKRTGLIVRKTYSRKWKLFGTKKLKKTEKFKGFGGTWTTFPKGEPCSDKLNMEFWNMWAREKWKIDNQEVPNEV